jgi:cytochrome c oxidase subunit 2
MSQPAPHLTQHIEVDSFWMPRASSTIADQTDQAYYITYWICIAFFVLIVTAMIYFAVKYKRKSDDERTSPIDHNFRLEVVWSLIPSILLVWLFVLGLRGYANAETAPNEAYQIRVTAHMYSWSFEYPDGSQTDEMYVPAGRPVKLVMSSQDVIHSMFIPEFRVKQDVVPGMYSSLWFTAKLPADGKAYETAIECAEYCGFGHSAMFNTVHVLPGAEFDKLAASNFDTDPTAPPELKGEKKFHAKCESCHSIDGSRLVGPSWKGIWGKQEKMSDGRMVLVDENYIRKSILEPNADIVDTFPSPSPMPTFAGQLSDKDIDNIIAFIKTQK